VLIWPLYGAFTLTINGFNSTKEYKTNVVEVPLYFGPVLYTY